MRSALTVLLVVVFSIPALAKADSLRCGRALVSEGDSKTEALAKCGEPAMKDTRVEYQTVTVYSDGLAVERTVSKTIDEWTYNFGPSNFLQYVTFEDGKLVSVRSGKYGF